MSPSSVTFLTIVVVARWKLPDALLLRGQDVREALSVYVPVPGDAEDAHATNADGPASSEGIKATELHGSVPLTTVCIVTDSKRR
jgi:hypothetical protein